MSSAGSGSGRSTGPSGIVWLAALAAFTANIDLSIVNLALPTIGRAFGASQSELAWTVNAYVLPYAISILAVGRLGDGFGHRTVLVTGSLLFAAGSLLAALAPAYPVLLVGRVLQGLGGSALLTIGLAIVSAGFTGAERGRALGIYFASGAIAAVVGPLAGGVLTTAIGWQGMFLSQIPLAVLVAGITWARLPARPGARRSLDVPALVAGTLALAGSNVALLQASSWGWGSPAILGAWVLAVVGIVAFVARERTAAEPAVRLEVFRSRIFVASALVGGAAWFGILSGSIQLALFLQTLRGLDPTSAALVILPWPLVAGLLFPKAGAIVGRIGPERAMIGSLVVSAIAALLMTRFDATTPLPIVSFVAALGGAPIALGVIASTMCALAEFPPEQAGVASGVFNSLRQVGSSLGVAIPAAVYDLIAGPSPGGPVVASGPATAAAFASRAVVFTIVLVAVVAILPRHHRVTIPTDGATGG